MNRANSVDCYWIPSLDLGIASSCESSYSRFGLIVRIPDDAFPPLTKYVLTFIILSQTLCEHHFSFPSSVTGHSTLIKESWPNNRYKYR